MQWTIYFSNKVDKATQIIINYNYILQFMLILAQLLPCMKNTDFHELSE